MKVIKFKILNYIFALLVIVSALPTVSLLFEGQDIFSYQADRMMEDNITAISVNAIIEGLSSEESSTPERSSSDENSGSWVFRFESDMPSASAFLKIFVLMIFPFFTPLILKFCISEMEKRKVGCRFKEYLMRSLEFMTPVQIVVQKLADIYDIIPSLKSTDFLNPCSRARVFFMDENIYGNLKGR